MLEELLRRMSLDLSALVTSLRATFASPVVTGKIVTAIMLNGGTTVLVKHGLGRTAKGAALISSSSAGAFTVDPVVASDSLTVRASSAVGSDVTLTLWCF